MQLIDGMAKLKNNKIKADLNCDSFKISIISTLGILYNWGKEGEEN